MKRNYYLICLVLLCALSALAAHVFRGMTIVNSTLDSSPIGSSSPSTGVFTGLSGPGLQKVINATGCTTAASLNAACTFTVTWPTSFADTNYVVVCVGNTAGGATAVLSNGTKSTTQTSGTIQNIGANASATTTTVDCVASHT